MDGIVNLLLDCPFLCEFVLLPARNAKTTHAVRCDGTPVLAIVGTRLRKIAESLIGLETIIFYHVRVNGENCDATAGLRLADVALNLDALRSGK
jgi:hypothetical protein